MSRSNILKLTSVFVAAVLAFGCTQDKELRTTPRPVQTAPSPPAALTSTSDQVVFIGLIAWAKNPSSNEYRAILPDADCDTDSVGNPESPSPPGTNFCRDYPAMYRHRPFLLFHNAKFVGSSLPGLAKQGVFVNVTNTPCTSPPPAGGCAALSVELEGIPLKEKSLELSLTGALTVDLDDLISSDDIPKYPNWQLELDSSVWNKTLGDNTDYVQAFVSVKGGDLEAAKMPPLDCDDHEVPNKEYGLEADDQNWGCSQSTSRFYAEEVFLTHQGGSPGNINFKLGSESYEVERQDPSLPVKIYVMNVHPEAWEAPQYRICSTHHQAFRWFYGLASSPNPTDYSNHFFTCNYGPAGGADRHCPGPVFDDP